MDMIFFKEKRILEKIEQMNLHFKERLDEQEERINRISMDTNSNYSMSYMTDKRTLELNNKLYSLNEDLKFIININIITIILLTIFIGINIYLLIH